MTEEVKEKKKKLKTEDILDKIEKTLSHLSRETTRLRVGNEKALKKIQDQCERSALSVSQSKKQIESFEDGLFHIMHNIKKNQFLYSHYPDEWAKNYTSIKKGMVSENKFMEQKGAVND